MQESAAGLRYCAYKLGSSQGDVSDLVKVRADNVLVPRVCVLTGGLAAQGGAGNLVHHVHAGRAARGRLVKSTSGA